jgi:hypothetical protein
LRDHTITPDDLALGPPRLKFHSKDASSSKSPSKPSSKLHDADEDDSIEKKNREKEQRKRDEFYRGCIETLKMERKDRMTHSGLNKMAETLNKLVGQTDIAKWLLLKRLHEISARMTLVHLKPGQSINLDEASMYIVLDG